MIGQKPSCVTFVKQKAMKYESEFIYYAFMPFFPGLF